MKVVIFLLGILSLSVTAVGQSKFDWSRYEKLPFVPDSIQSFENEVVLEGIINNIQTSKNDLEIRMYIQTINNNHSAISIFKCKGDSCFVEALNVYRSRDSLLDSNLNYISYKNGQYLQSLNQKFKSQIKFDKYFTELTKNDFFVMKDQSNLLKVLREKKVVYYNPCVNQTHCYDIPVLIEIKFRNKFRNFKMLSVDYFLDNIPQHIKEFETNHIIKLLLKNIFNPHLKTHEKN